MGNKVKVMQLKNKQFMVTIPKSIAELMGIVKGEKLEFRLINGNIQLHKVWNN